MHLCQFLILVLSVETRHIGGAILGGGVLEAFEFAEKVIKVIESSPNIKDILRYLDCMELIEAK